MLLAALDRGGAPDDARRRARRDGEGAATGSAAARQRARLRRGEEADRAPQKVGSVGRRPADGERALRAARLSGTCLLIKINLTKIKIKINSL